MKKCYCRKNSHVSASVDKKSVLADTATGGTRRTIRDPNKSTECFSGFFIFMCE